MRRRGWFTTSLVVMVLFINALASAAGQAVPPQESLTLSWGPLSSGWKATYVVRGASPSSKALTASGQMVLAADPAAELTFEKGVRLNGKDGALLAHVAPRLLKGLATIADFRASEQGSKVDLTTYDIGETRVMGRRTFSIVSKRADIVPLRYWVEVDATKGLWLLCAFQVFVEGGHTSHFQGEVDELMNALRVGAALRLVVDNTPEHPFALSIRLEDGGAGSGAASALRAHQNVRLVAHVFDQDANALKLDDRFMVNGAWDNRQKHVKAGSSIGPPDPLEAAQKNSLPITIPLAGGQDIRLTLVPSLAKLAKWRSRYQSQGVHLPSIPTPLRVSLGFEVVATNAQGKDEVIALSSKIVSVDWVGRVVGRRFEEPTILEQNRLGQLGALLPRRSGALADYANRPFDDAKGERRVLIERRSDPFYTEVATRGSTPGVPVKADELIRIGDAIRIDPTDMAAYGVRGVEAPRKTRAGCVAVRFEFVDGVRAELVVYEDAGAFPMRVGADADASGFGAEGWAWAYFSAEFLWSQVKDHAIEAALTTLLPPAGAAFGAGSGIEDVSAVFSFLVQRVNAQHVRLNSQVFMQLDGSGRLRLTTREGRPIVYSKATGPQGLTVPAGKTGTFETNVSPRLADTDAETAALADQRLAALDARPVRPGSRPTTAGTTTPAPSPTPAAAAATTTRTTSPVAGPASPEGRAGAGPIVLDDVGPGSLAEWGSTYDPREFNPRFFREEVRSAFDGSTAIRTRAVGNTVATCETKWTSRVYATGAQDSGNAVLEAYVDFDFNGTTYNLPSVTFELLDEQSRALGRRTYFGKDVIGQFNRSRLGATGYVELPTATGVHRFDLAEIGAGIRFAKVAVYLQNYTCQGQNSIVFDHLVLRRK